MELSSRSGWPGQVGAWVVVDGLRTPEYRRDSKPPAPRLRGPPSLRRRQGCCRSGLPLSGELPWRRRYRRTSSVRCTKAVRLNCKTQAASAVRPRSGSLLQRIQARSQQGRNGAAADWLSGIFAVVPAATCWSFAGPKRPRKSGSSRNGPLLACASFHIHPRCSSVASSSSAHHHAHSSSPSSQTLSLAAHHNCYPSSTAFLSHSSALPRHIPNSNNNVRQSPHRRRPRRARCCSVCLSRLHQCA